MFSKNSIRYVTRLKDNAIYEARKEFDISANADSGVLKDEEIILSFGDKRELKHRSRRIAYWDSENNRLFEFITNNFEMSAEKIALNYKKRWQIELFKQLKQNFPLKYFLGDNENAIEMQNLVSHACQFTAYPAAKQCKTQLVVLQSGVHFKAAIDELHQCLSLSGRPRRKLARNSKRK